MDGGSRSLADGHGAEAEVAPWLVPLSDVAVDEEMASVVDEVVRSGWWSMGPKVAAFEQAFATACQSPHAIAVSSGTAALHLALMALECGPGDEVILPSLNFVAVANMVAYTGASPVFCDIHGPQDLNLDPADVARAIGPRTKAIVVLHYGGFPCDMDAVLELADRHGLAVIEDAAHAPGATWRGRPCGTMGQIGCFSFFSNKNLPVGEGGMLVTNDDKVARRARLLRSHGMTTLTWDRHRGHAHTYDVVEAGMNYRLDEVRAALGLVQLERLEARNAARARIAARYLEVLDGVAGVTLPFSDPEAQAQSAHHLAVAVLPAGVSREAVRSNLEKRRIQTSVHYPPIHTFSAYAAQSPRRPLPQTDALADRLVTLPLFPHMDDDQVEAVTDALLAALRTAS